MNYSMLDSVNARSSLVWVFNEPNLYINFRLVKINEPNYKTVPHHFDVRVTCFQVEPTPCGVEKWQYTGAFNGVIFSALLVLSNSILSQQHMNPIKNRKSTRLNRKPTGRSYIL